MYTFKSRVRYSEIGMDKRLTLPNVVNYFQDCSTFQSEGLELGLETLNKRRRAWLLTSWQVEVSRFPEIGEEIVVGTFPYDFNTFFGYRNFFIQDQRGNNLVKADSIWIYISTDTGKPTRATEAEISGYELEPRLNMNYADRKIPASEGGESLEPVIVRRHHIDTNGHVNNSQYVKMAIDCLPIDFYPTKLHVEYKKAAVLGEILTPRLFSKEDGYTVVLSGAKDKVCAVVELRKD